MKFVDFRTGDKSASIRMLFPGWKRGESVAFLSPHDDDVVLGAGILVRAVLAAGGQPHILIFCKGDAGYSTPAARRTIVRTRRREALAAYATLGVDPADIHFFGLPDLSLMAYVNRKVPARAGVLDRFLRLLRRHRAGRVVFSSPHFENWDHTAVYYVGMYASPQAGDPILADLGDPSPVSSFLVYSVWGDFAPPAEGNDALRADVGILAGRKDSEIVRKALQAFGSQSKVLENTAAMPGDRPTGPGGRLELYQRARVREPIDYGPYFERLRKVNRKA